MNIFTYTALTASDVLPKETLEYVKSLEDEVAASSRQAWEREQREEAADSRARMRALLTWPHEHDEDEHNGA